MIMRKGLSAFVASSIALGSTAAVANTGAVDSVRQPAGVAEAENMGAVGGMGLGWLIALAVAAGVALVIIEDDDDEDPVSP